MTHDNASLARTMEAAATAAARAGDLETAERIASDIAGLVDTAGDPTTISGRLARTSAAASAGIARAEIAAARGRIHSDRAAAGAARLAEWIDSPRP